MDDHICTEPGAHQKVLIQHYLEHLPYGDVLTGFCRRRRSLDKLASIALLHRIP
jgi:hypothetical protein